MIRYKIFNDSVNIIFLSPKIKYAIQTVTINNFTYAKATIIVIDSSDNIPMFDDNEIIFQYITLSTTGFYTHYVFVI